MVKEIKLPKLGQTMEEGTIVNCLVKVGDEVKKGDVICEIETDKATLEMESPVSGFVKFIVAEINQTLPVGAPVMVVGDQDEQVPMGYLEQLTGGKGLAAGVMNAPASQMPTTIAPMGAQPEPGRPGKVMASPRAKKLAEELGVDLAKIKGTGPAGKITEVDVQQAAQVKPVEAKVAQPAQPARPTRGEGVPPLYAGEQDKAKMASPRIAEARLGATVPVNRLQRITAERMLKSKREIPCFYLTVKVDMTPLVGLRTQMNEAGDVKVAFNDFIMKAVAIGLEKYPLMTGQLDGDAIRLADAIHIGLAISVPDGLIAPLVKDVNEKDIRQIARDSLALIERTRAEKLDLSDLEGGCITVSNLGAFGIESFIPIVVPGQCSILGIGRITDTCVPDNGNILIRKLMNMTLAVDHKVANGAYAAQFLDFVKKTLEDPKGFTI